MRRPHLLFNAGLCKDCTRHDKTLPSIEHFQRKTHAVLQFAAILISALIADRRQKLEETAMRLFNVRPRSSRGENSTLVMVKNLLSEQAVKLYPQVKKAFQYNLFDWSLGVHAL